MARTCADLMGLPRALFDTHTQTCWEWLIGFSLKRSGICLEIGAPARKGCSVHFKHHPTGASSQDCPRGEPSGVCTVCSHRHQHAVLRRLPKSAKRRCRYASSKMSTSPPAKNKKQKRKAWFGLEGLLHVFAFRCHDASNDLVPRSTLKHTMSIPYQESLNGAPAETLLKRGSLSKVRGPGCISLLVDCLNVWPYMKNANSLRAVSSCSPLST